MVALATALDLVWGWCNVYLVTPDVYLHLLWNLALQVIPRPTPASEIIRSMARRGRALTASDLRQLRTAMDEQAELRCFQRATATLQSHVIASATRGALARPSKPVPPYQGISRDASPPSPDVDARLAEVTAQASHVTEYRATRVDHTFFKQRMNHQKLAPWVDPVLELPLSVLGAMMCKHLDCRDTYQRDLFCLRESSLPLLNPARVFSSVNTSGSPFASADQCPQALLCCLRGGWRPGCEPAVASGPCRYSQPQQPCSTDGD